MPMQSGLVRRFWLHNEEFAFDLCRKPRALFGVTPIDHWWMRVTPLYGQKQGSSGSTRNRTEILRLFWAKVRDLGATNLRDPQERLLLASVVPWARATGSRKIFADAFLASGSRKQRDNKVAFLENALAAAPDKTLSRAEFHEHSWQALGRPEFPAGLQEVYERQSHDLLDGACAMLSRGQLSAALETVRQIWDRRMRTIARHIGHAEEKIVLDVLSYEARAAFHHCYSVVWSALIPLLEREDHLTRESLAFHRFWHTDWRDSQTETSLFHGHAFGLHPGTSLFMQTRTGPRLLGDWLANLESAELLGRVLNGLLIALFDYQEQRKETAENRSHSQERGSGDLEAVERIQQERRRGRFRGSSGRARD